MYSFKKWLYKPRKSDKSLLAQFYFADEELNNVATELDSFDSRKDPERCQALVSQLRTCQDRVLTTVQRMMTEAIPDSRTNRDFRVKFPDDVVQENLSGQLWFGAECLAAGSSIMNREVESTCMRPLARALTKNLDSLRHILREQCLISVNEYSERIKEALIIFDKLFAEFELRYVSAMVPVKTVKEYETIQEITVLFSETAIRAKALGYITTDMIDEYDPALMFTIPRLAIVCGLLIFPDGPLNPDNPSWTMSDMFRPFQTLLFKIRELLFTLSDAELFTLERALCSQEEPEYLDAATTTAAPSTATTTTITTSSNGITTLIYGPPTTPASTSTIAIQTESFGTGRNPTEDAVSWCSDDSAELMQTEEQQQHSQQMQSRRDCPFEEIACHTGSLHNEGRGQVCPEAAVVACEECETWRDESCDDSGPSDLNGWPDSGGTNGRHLNKSDSKDSGLHSEVVSSSNSQHTISSSHSTQLLATSSPVPPSSAEQMPELYLEDDDEDGGMADVSLETMAGSMRADPRHETPTKIYRAGSGTPDTGHSEESSAAGDVEECYEEMFCSGDSVYRKCYTEEEEGEDGEEEEEQFYTPLTGFSPLHQPSLCTSELDEGVNEYMSSGTLNYSVDAENCDSYPVSPTSEVSDSCSYVGNASPLCLVEGSDGVADSRTFTCQFSGVLQKVQAMFTSSPSVSVEVEGSWDSEMSDSPLTDTTLTDIAPLDSSAGENPASNCDSCAMDISCDREQENQNDFVLPQVQGDGGGWAVADGAEVSRSRHSSSHCDRCTQTPHSVISNEMSSKIHHHHHHRKHSSPARCHTSGCACSTPASVTSSYTAVSTSPVTLGDSQGNDKDKKDLPSVHHRAPQTAPVALTSAQSLAEHQTGGKRCSRAGPPRSGASKRMSSGRPGQQKAGLVAPPSVHEAARRQQRGSKGWTQSGTARRNTGASSSGSDCEGSTASTSDCDQDSTETSSYNSESHDDEEIALAVQAAELVNRNQARARFRSSSDMIHRLFVCISGVADQLQTNFAGDLRNILRVVFNLNCSEPIVMEEEKTFRRHRRGNRFFRHALGGDTLQQRATRDPPAWVPDDQSVVCMSCKTPFTFVRRRHHCRNCGKIFCGRCSSNAVSLPHFGHSKPVRVCNHCFVFQVNPFAVS